MGEYIKASLLGCVLGDAYGGAFARSELPMRGPIWSIGADAQQLFATCEAIVNAGEVNADTIAASLLHWYRYGNINNPGPATLMALVELSGGKSRMESGQKGPITFTNEAVTRLAPLAFFLDPSTESGYQMLKEVCHITHQGEPAMDAGLAVVLALRSIRNDQQNFLTLVMRQLPDSPLKDRMAAISHRPELSLREVGRIFGASSHAIDSVPLALAAARLAPVVGFEGTMKGLVSAGGEMRSNCAIGGLVTGNSCGMAGLPSEWLEKLKDVKHYTKLIGIADAFSALVDERLGVKKLF
jgi:ADP-ribosyl-[dinitrogen reductase] hydrolase